MRTSLVFSPHHGALLSSAAAALLLCLAPACSDSGNPGTFNSTTTTEPDTSTDTDTVVEPVDPNAGPYDAEFVALYKEILTESATMTKTELLTKFSVDPAPSVTQLSYDPLASTFMDTIDEALELTTAEKAGIAENGFVVSERLTYDTFGDALLDVFQKDLPVLVTTDMILHALHKSYDDLLLSMERELLVPTLTQVLADTHAGLADAAVGRDADALLAFRDADLFLTVARSLLSGTTVASNTGGIVDEQRDALLESIVAEQFQSKEIFGTLRKMDFSQFKPRGHYEGEPELERYFQAMIWLGRADLRFMEQDPTSGEWVFHTRQLAIAQLLNQSVRESGALTGWDLANDLITLMVGPVDYIDFRGVARLVDDHALTDASVVTTLSGAARAAVVSDLLGGRYGEQKINSHWLETDPFSAESTPLPPSFAFLGQRFVVDSYAMANVVYDNIIHNGEKVQRVLPSPLDVAFVLGNDEALVLLGDELDAYPYQGALNSLRFLVDYYKPEFWESNVYNLWLSAIRGLNAPTRGDAYPEPMRTDAWRDKNLHTQLASWAQLRHDTLLYAKQSYTGGVSCEHPDGFVEPYPDFYGALERMADVAGQTLVNVNFPNEWIGIRISDFFNSWRTNMAMLKKLAEKELAGMPFSEEEVSFLKSTIMADGGCGAPVFSGWYPTLYFLGSDKVAEYKPTIADVHTNPNQGPLPGPNVLHVATGRVNQLILSTNTCNGPRAYVGPVMSYYEVDPKAIVRHTDSEWEAMLNDTANPPARPTWTRSFIR